MHTSGCTSGMPTSGNSHQDAHVRDAHIRMLASGCPHQDARQGCPHQNTLPVLRLLLGVVYGHSKAVGASEGLPGLTRYAAAWSPAFTRPTPSDLLPFVAALLSPPAGGEVARLFGPRMLGAVGSVVLNAPAPLLLAADLSPTTPQQQQQQQQQQLCALGVLVDACVVLEGGSSTAHTLPLLLTAQPGGVKLAAAVEKGVVAWVDAATAAAAGASSNADNTSQNSGASPPATPSKKVSKKQERLQAAQAPQQQQSPQQLPRIPTQRELESLTSTEQLSAVWAGLQLLPHASQSRAHAVGLCERVKDTTSRLCGLVQASVSPRSGPTVPAAAGEMPAAGKLAAAAAAAAATLDARRCVAGLVCLHALTLELLAELLPAVTTQHAEQTTGQQGRWALC
eukprot:1140834-Pelagomonas_calceolata.AAC.1